MVCMRQEGCSIMLLLCQQQGARTSAVCSLVVTRQVLKLKRCTGMLTFRKLAFYACKSILEAAT